MIKQEPVEGEDTIESPNPQENIESYLNGWSSGDDDDSGYGQESESSGVPAITPVKTIDMEVTGDEARTEFKMLAKTHPNLHRLHTGLPPSSQPPRIMYDDPPEAAHIKAFKKHFSGLENCRQVANFFKIPSEDFIPNHNESVSACFTDNLKLEKQLPEADSALFDYEVIAYQCQVGVGNDIALQQTQNCYDLYLDSVSMGKHIRLVHNNP